MTPKGFTLPELWQGSVTVREAHGEMTLETSADSLLKLLTWLRDESDPAFNMLTDQSGVDGLKLGWEPRFKVSYHLLAPSNGDRLRVQVPALEGEEGPELPSATGLWESADWNEREIWDLMGIRFSGHPDLRRILLTEDYEHGHPLQKQIPTRGKHDDNR
ncbi:NADH-quinone oxidoreductase subunit C [bacterium]|nr:NADH-quinone oxidoreductase subunit C [bacterium]